MRRGIILAMIAAFCAATLAAASACHQSAPPSHLATIRAAQKSSFWGAEPKWMSFTSQPALFTRVRDSGYAYCLSNGRIDAICAQHQDDAVHAAILALVTVDTRRAMTDKSTLGESERWLANNPDVAARVASGCWSLYRAHGASDARILSVCLANLVPGMLLDVPVP